MEEHSIISDGEGYLGNFSTDPNLVKVVNENHPRIKSTQQHKSMQSKKYAMEPSRNSHGKVRKNDNIDQNSNSQQLINNYLSVSNNLN